MLARPKIDVSHLPPMAYDARSTAWWGNVLFMVIESTTVALLVVSYFYTRQNFEDWPPPRADAGTATARSLPDLRAASLNMVLLAASCVLMARANRAARKGDRRTTVREMIALAVLGWLALALRFAEFPALQFRWDDNAYGSLVWTILFVHLTYLLGAAVEASAIALWIVLYGLDENQTDDVTLTADYWYWMVGLWVPLYVIVYWTPRLL
jgi:cytochrome c oxidase subunit 3